MKKLDDSGSAGGIVILIGMFLLAGILFISVGFAIDRLTLIASKMFVDTASSQMRFDTVNLQLMVFRAEPFILLIFAGINYWVTEIRQFSGTIPVGTMLMNCGEMIILSLVLVAFTLFGGYGIDLAVQFANGWAVAGVDLDLTGVVQYGGPLFYGFMFILTIGVVIQFCISCVQLTDYSRSTSYGY